MATARPNVSAEETMMRKYPVWPMNTTNPKEFYPGQGGEASIFQGTVSSLDPTAVIAKPTALKSMAERYRFLRSHTILGPKEIKLMKRAYRGFAKAIQKAPQKELDRIDDVRIRSGTLDSLGRYLPAKKVGSNTAGPKIELNLFDHTLDDSPSETVLHELVHARQFKPDLGTEKEQATAVVENWGDRIKKGIRHPQSHLENQAKDTGEWLDRHLSSQLSDESKGVARQVFNPDWYDEVYKRWLNSTSKELEQDKFIDKQRKQLNFPGGRGDKEAAKIRKFHLLETANARKRRWDPTTASPFKLPKE